MALFVFFFFFSSRRRHTRLVSDWSSDVCSSDLRWRQKSPPREPATRGKMFLSFPCPYLHPLLSPSSTSFVEWRDPRQARHDTTLAIITRIRKRCMIQIAHFLSFLCLI